ncbi:hypothetical protein PAT3040_03570 [Paenibacillus agaridevorans]|uniref:Pyrrolo-quinoline quinone repeat domain-containing protein n=1 Tax=Paenibacillus agaridevorans TaxID=171404 RepID=A0A2R5EYQ6_9BACL|nr:PQQ-binding-like beta-propeller repeat protein [Paenibacillus agaridevorans]GBG08953.1 hypothetical protein PAT3040_03570 [Paenibacillus agaridevorans]
MTFPKKKATLLSVIALIWLLAGCENSATQAPSPSVTPAATNQKAISLASASTLEITDASIREHLDGTTTKSQARSAYGQPSYIGKGVYWIGNDLVDVEVWRYDQAPHGYTYSWDDSQGYLDLRGLLSGKVNGQLLLYWDEQGKLLDATYHYHDSDGNLQTLLTAAQLEYPSSSTDNRIAREQGFRIGDTVQVHAEIDATRLPQGADNTVVYRAVPGHNYQLTALTEHFAQLVDIREGEGWYDAWVPVWMLTAEASSLSQQAPEQWSVAADGTPIYWQPADDAVARRMDAGERLLVVGSSGNWRAVIVEEKDLKAEPRVLWIKDEGTYIHEGQVNDLFDSTQASYLSARTVAYYFVREGAPQAELEKLLGLPQAVERSGNVKSTGEPMETLERWRYESETAELLIDWSPQGKVVDYTFSPREEGQPFTKEQSLRWRTTSDLAYNFFIGRTDRALLISGEDGGFSGMHYDSNLFALDPATGRKLWQRDLGFHTDRFILSSDRRYMAVHMPPENNAEQERLGRLDVLDTSNGSNKWTLKHNLPDDTFDVSYGMAGKVVAMIYTTGDFYSPNTYRSFIEAYALRDGRKLWSRELNHPGRFIPSLIAGGKLIIEYGMDSGVPVGNEIAAYEPKNGKEVWRMEGMAAPLSEWADHFYYEARALDDRMDQLWVKSPLAWTLVDTNTGDPLSTLPRRDDIGYEIVNDRYAIRLSTKDGAPLGYNSDVTSEWLDLGSSKTLWTMDGTLERAIVVGDAVYAWSEGTLRRLRLSDGHQYWLSKPTSRVWLQWFDGQLLAASDAGVLVFDPHNGEALYRIAGTRHGGYDAMEHWRTRAQLTVLDGTLYIGSDNGFFSVADRLVKSRE